MCGYIWEMKNCERNETTLAGVLLTRSGGEDRILEPEYLKLGHLRVKQFKYAFSTWEIWKVAYVLDVS